MDILENVIAYFKASRARRNCLLGGIVLLALLVRLLLFGSPSKDITDFFGPWYDTFLRYGRDTALGMDFYNYSPPTLYLFDLMTVFTFIPRDAAIRLVAVVFDFFAAWGVYRILKLLFRDKLTAWMGTIAFLFMPAMVASSAMWGQADIFYLSFLIWMLYFLLKGKNLLATIAFAIAFAFKLQALMAAPLFLILIVRRKYPLYWLLVIPAVYFLSVVPAWVAGRPLGELLTVYLSQYEQYTLPSANAANPYIFFNWVSVNDRSLVAWIGLGVTAAFMLSYLFLRIFKWKGVAPKDLVYDLALLTLVLPFLLPKMHERYFLPAAVFLLLLTFFNLRALWPALLCQVAVLMSYVPYFTRWSNEWVHVGAVFNMAAAVCLVMMCVRHHQREEVGR